MPASGQSPSSATESGSSLLEAIVALAIISILGIGAWNAVGASIRIAGRIKEKALESAHLLQLDDELRELAGRVRAPFWASGHSLVTEAGRIQVWNLDGDPEKALTVSFQEGVLTLEGGDRAMRFTDFARVEFSAADSEELGTYGLTLSLEAKGGRTCAMTARFGSLPMQGSTTQ